MANSPRENSCVVCFRNIDIYAVGDCDHYDRICYICSTRLRVLCNKHECPICRKDIPKVIFSKHRQPFGALSKISYPVDHKYKIAFTDQDVRDEYELLLQESCTICPEKQIFRSFGLLKDHIRKEHELFFCELCIDNLKLFTHERRCYTRKELGIHRRIGDKDDTSHRGHPHCQFCEDRFMDKDELFRHLRKEHFYCHFCEADGVYQFYGHYKYLENHFRDDHFLCEEGDCVAERFTGVFRSEIDFKAHKATQHSKNLNKQQAKQARTLELEFTIRPRVNNSDAFDPAARRGRRPIGNPRAGREPRSQRDDDHVEAELQMDSMTSNNVSAPNTHCQKQFPQLGNVDDGQISINMSSNKVYHKQFNPSSEEEFPTLTPQTTSARLTVSSSQGKMPTNSVLFKINNTDKNGGATGNISIQVTSKPKSSSGLLSQDFPALSKKPKHISPPANTTVPPSQLNPVKQTESKPATKSNDCNGWQTIGGKPSKKQFEDEFPQLIGKTSGKPSRNVSSLTIPVGSSSWNKPTTVNAPVEAPFTVVKGKAAKAGKNAFTEQSSKLKEKGHNQKKEGSKKNESSKNAELAVNKTSSNEFTSSDNTASKQNIKESPYIPPDYSDIPSVLSPKTVSLEDEFPPLITNVIKSAPPGFSKTVSNPSQPPPGFTPSIQNSLNIGSSQISSLTLSSVARQLTNPSPPSPTMDIANISSFPKLTRAAYTEPDNFEERNRTLIQKIRDLLDGDEAAFLEFKTLSGQFRKSVIQANDYYNKCIVIFGKEKFLTVFPELLVLLPDIGKEQELLCVYNQVSKKENQSSGAVPKSSAVNNQNSLHVLVCAACQQVLAGKDFQKHMLCHNEDALFPPLGTANHSSTAKVTWVKK